MRIESTWRWPLLVVVFLAMGHAPARAGYFVNAGAGSPLATYFFGDVDHSKSAGATSSTFYTDGINYFSSDGSSSSSLRTGELHASSSANFGYDPAALPNMTSSFQFGNASFGDSLTFLGNFTGQQATLHVSVDGTFTGNPAYNGSQFQFMVLPAGTIDANAANSLHIFDNPGNVATYNRIDALPTTNPLAYDVNVTLNGLNPTIEFAADLDIVASVTQGQSFAADYSDTALVTLTAPNGVTVRSGSGVFPGTAAVPEPSTLSLAACGLASAGLIALLRRRRA